MCHSFVINLFQGEIFVIMLSYQLYQVDCSGGLFVKQTHFLFVI
jgi:hypothetical protein